jgi:tRNA (mo5U34)-methyltransferase
VSVHADSTAGAEPPDPQAAVAATPFWYHSIEVAPGVVTPGWFDLRPTLAKLPWPDVAGKRCLDVGTYDGQLAFELERRGAAEVVAIDIPSHELWDWPPRIRSQGVEYLASLAGPRRGEGFRVARELLGSSARLEELSVYDLVPEAFGSFDVVVCGTLLLHLRDPLAALVAIRSVCRESFLSTNQVELALSLVQRRRPMARLDGVSDLLQWWIPNAAGHRRLVEAAGFDVVRESALYSVPFGSSHPPVGRSPRMLAARAAQKLLTGAVGAPHHAVLAVPGD